MKRLRYIDEAWLNKTYTLKNLIRYNHRSRLTSESVAEHSFFVALIVLKVCEKLKLGETTTSQCLLKALLHDMPETELNDITYDVKEKLGLRLMLKQHEDEYFDRYFPKQAELLKNDSDNVINAIVKYADAASVLQYASREVSLGNTTITSIIAGAYERLEKLEKKLEELL